MNRCVAIAVCLGAAVGAAWGEASPRRLCPGAVGRVWSPVPANGEAPIEISAGPEAAFVEPRSRFVYWTPSEADKGTHTLRIRTDSELIEVPVEVVPLRKTLFVFAHSDDEFGSIATVDRYHRAGVDVHAVWTCTSAGGRSRSESAAAWAELGVPAENLHYTSPPCRRPVGLMETRDALAALLRRHEFQQVFVVGYEGGHIQHDLTNVALAEALRLVAFRGQAYEFGLYNFHRFPLPSLLRLIPATPPRQVARLMWAEYRRLEGLTEFYPSQKRVTTGFRLALTERQKRRQEFRPLPRWDYTRRPYTGRPLWYRLSPGHHDCFDRDFLSRVEAYYEEADLPRPVGPFEQDFQQ